MSLEKYSASGPFIIAIILAPLLYFGFMLILKNHQSKNTPSEICSSEIEDHNLDTFKLKKDIP